MKPEHLLTCFKVPATDSYPKPNASSSLTHSLTPWSKGLFEKLMVTQLYRNSLPFMEPEGSLPCSQEPTAGPCPEPDASSHDLPTDLPIVRVKI